MKESFILLFSALIGVITASAYDFEAVNSDGMTIYYDINPDGSGVTVTNDGVSKYMGVVKLPASVTYNGTKYAVTQIGYRAFAGCKDMKSVDIPASVTAIGESAFYNCSGLTEVSLPASLTSIGNQAFTFCTALTSISIPEGVTSIGSYAFAYCNYLEGATIPSTVVSIGEKAFNDCVKLLNLTAWNNTPGNIAMGDDVFLGVNVTSCTLTVPLGALSAYRNASQWGEFTNIEETDLVFEHTNDYGVTLTYMINPDFKSVTVTYSKSGYGSYSGKVSISEEITYEGVTYTVTAIGNYAFYGCSGVTTLNLSEGLTSVGAHAFDGCSGMDVNSYFYASTIGEYAFAGCSSLTHARFLSPLTSIGSNAFQGCSALDNISLYCNPDPSAVSMGENVFQGVDTSACSLVVPGPEGISALYGSAPQWKDFGTIITVYDIAAESQSGTTIFYRKTGSNTLKVVHDFVSQYQGVVNVPATIEYDGTPYVVTGIGSDAFAGCLELTHVSLPHTVTYIDDYAFYNCTKLPVIDLPLSLTTIGNFAFYSCKSLTVIDIPSGVTTIGNKAFNLCSSLIEAKIPASVTYIGNQAFYSCSNLSQFTVNNPDPSSIILGDHVFPSILSGTTLYVPAGSKESYESALQWSDFGTIMESNYSFAIPNSNGTVIYYTVNPDGRGVSVVSQYADFSDYYNFVAIPATVTFGDAIYEVNAIAPGAFSYCWDLLGVSLPNSITSIGQRAFEGCSAMTEFKIPASVTAIGDLAFFGCSLLSEVTVNNPDPAAITLGNNIFLDINLGIATLFVPAGSESLYREIQPWNEFGTIAPISTDPGDIDSDGFIDIADITALIGIIVSGEGYETVGDVNSDGVIDVADITAIISRILGE